MTDRFTPDCAADAELRQLIETHLDRSNERIALLTHQGQPIWVKQPEELGRSVLRITKGDGRKSFERERAALRQLRELGVSVPEILAEGPDFFAISDCGVSLNNMLYFRTHPASERVMVFEKAGAALANLHSRGISHGRPSLRDTCWDGKRIAFIDFERFDLSRPTPRGPAQDVVMFLLNAFSQTLHTCPEIDAAIAGYKANDSAGIWAEACRLGRRLRWTNWLTKPIQRKRVGAKEFKAIPLTFAVLNAG